MRDSIHNKIDDIEILRAFAVLLVILEHIYSLFPWRQGRSVLHMVTSFWGGVDVFFVISGFVITTQMLRIYAENPNEKFAAFAIPFWIRRIYRIWPSAILWISLVLAASIWFNKSGAFGNPVGNFADWVASILQVANLHWYHCFQQKGICGVNTIYWSLSLEEQFYLVYPFIFFFLMRRNRKTLVIFLLAVILIQFFIPRPPHVLLWEIRTDALAWGAVIALIINHPMCKLVTPGFLASRLPALLVTCLALLFISALGPNRVSAINTGLIALISGGLVFIAAQDKGLTWPSGFGRSLLVWIGGRSYAIYLTHCFVFWGLRELAFRYFPDKHYSLPLGTAAVVLTLILSELNFRFVETPLRKKGARVAKNIRQSIAELPPAVDNLGYTSTGQVSVSPKASE